MLLPGFSGVKLAVENGTALDGQRSQRCANRDATGSLFRIVENRTGVLSTVPVRTHRHVLSLLSLDLNVKLRQHKEHNRSIPAAQQSAA